MKDFDDYISLMRKHESDDVGWDGWDAYFFLSDRKLFSGVFFG